jgi:hypothetical protein
VDLDAASFKVVEHVGKQVSCEKVPTTPAGRSETENFTACAVPDFSQALMVMESDVPAAIISMIGPNNEKSKRGGAVTNSINEAVLFRLPEVAVTAMGYAPATAELAAVNVRVV